MLEIKKTRRKKNLNKRQINSMWNMINKWLPSNMTKEEFVSIIERTNNNPDAELPQEINYAISQFTDSIKKHRTTVKINMKDINDCFEDADEEDIIEKNKENIDTIMSEINNEKKEVVTKEIKEEVRSLKLAILDIYKSLPEPARKSFKDLVVYHYKQETNRTAEEKINASSYSLDKLLVGISVEKLRDLKQSATNTKANCSVFAKAELAELKNILDEKPKTEDVEAAIEKANKEEDKVTVVDPKVKYARNPFEKSDFTDILNNYCCLPEKAKKGFDDVVINMYKNTNPEATEAEIDKLDFAAMVSTLSDEQLAKLKAAMIRVSKKDQSISVIEQPEVDNEKKLIPVMPTKEQKDTSLTKQDKKEILGMVNIGIGTFILLAAIGGIHGCTVNKDLLEKEKNKNKTGNEENDPTTDPTASPTQEITITPTVTVTYENPVGDVDVEKIYEADGIVFASQEDYLEYLEYLENKGAMVENNSGAIMYPVDVTNRDIGVVNPDGTYTVTEVGTDKSRTYESRDAFLNYNEETDCWLLAGNGIYYRMENYKVKSK